MKLPSFRRLFSQDYQKEYQRLIETLSVSLNNGIEVLYEALNNGVSLRDNINCTVKDVIVKVDASGNPVQTTSFLLNSNSKIDGLMVISAINQVSSTTYPTSGVFVTGTQSANSVIINNVTGLQANQAYSLRIVAFQT